MYNPFHSFAELSRGLMFARYENDFASFTPKKFELVSNLLSVWRAYPSHGANACPNQSSYTSNSDEKIGLSPFCQTPQRRERWPTGKAGANPLWEFFHYISLSAKTSGILVVGTLAVTIAFCCIFPDSSGISHRAWYMSYCQAKNL